MPAIFFDLGQTLAEPRIGANNRLEGLDVFPFVPDLLKELKGKKIRLGLISHTGVERKADMERVLRDAGLLDFFDPALLIYSSEVNLRKDSPKIFELAAQTGALKLDECVFVGENRSELCHALAAGFRITRHPHRAFEISRGTRVPLPDVANLANCTTDARLAFLDNEAGPDDPTEFNDLVGRVEAARLKMPPLYRESYVDPFLAQLRQLGSAGFAEVLLRDPARERLAGLVLDIAHTILQNAEKYQERATDAFEEVVSDLYDGFLSAHDRRGIKPADHEVIAPLVKWGNPDFGPYTWPIEATFSLGVRAAVVCLPPSHARGGLMGWAALAHEAAGHDILAADDGLDVDISRQVRQELLRRNLGFGLAQYWSTRIDETASDVMGILNMGPAAAIGLISYFRGLRGAGGGASRLSSVGPAGDSHPADILRAYLAAATVRLLDFEGGPYWSNVIKQEADRDLRTIQLAGQTVPAAAAIQSAEIVAEVIATKPMASLNNHALIEIQDWDDGDEAITEQLRRVLTTTTPLPAELASGIFAAHVVAAAVTAALRQNANLGSLFNRMITILKIMHDKNPSWGPMFISHPSTISRHVAYMRISEGDGASTDDAEVSGLEAARTKRAARGMCRA